MTFKEFAEKWDGKELPLGTDSFIGTAVGMLDGAGWSKEEMLELVGDVFDLSRHLETAEGLAEHDLAVSELMKSETKH